MRLASFVIDGRPGYGLVTNSGIVDLGRRFTGCPTLSNFIANGLEAARSLEQAPADHAADAAGMLPVIPNPKHVYCAALNYRSHFREAGANREMPSHPAVFLRAADSLTGHRQPIIRPRVSRELDYEGELAVIIGRRGRHIAPDEAMSYVAGYACFNDASVRDWQKHTRQATPGKNFFATGALGPWLVTRDEVRDPHRLAITTRLNGAVMQQGNTSEMLFDVPAFISYVSAFLPLEPGDVLATGTPSGVGYSRTPPVYLAPGDVVEVEIEGVGTLVNPIADE